MVSPQYLAKNNSTIFKTINSSVDQTRKTLALFNKDWNTYKVNWQQGFSQNGFAGGLKSIFQTSSTNSAISKDQVQILRNWNNAVTHGCTNQETFNRIIAKADDNTKMYFAGLNKSKASIEGLKNAQNAAKQSTIGLTIAQTALNMAISMGLMAVISLAINGFDKLINSAKRASEAADEAFSNTNEKVQQNEQEAKSLDELISKYAELKERGSLDVDDRKEVKELQNDITDLVGTQAKNLDLVNGKLDDEIKKLDEISEKEAKRAYQTAAANYRNAKKANEEAVGNDSYLLFDGITYVGKREKDAEKILQDAGFLNVHSGGFFGLTKTFVRDEMDSDRNLLENAQEKLDYLQSMVDVLEQGGQGQSELHDGLIKQIDIYQAYIDNQQNAANSLIDSWIIYSQYANGELSKITVDSVDTFEEYRQKMIDEAKKDDGIAQILADGTLSEDALEVAINNFMSTATQFSTWYNQWKDKMNDNIIVNEIPLFNAFQNTSFGDRIQHITDLFNEGALSHKKYFDSLQSEIDNFDASGFTNSVEDMNKASEQFFVDSMQQTASGLSSLINSFNNGEMSISEYLDGYLAIGNTLSTLTDNLQENSAAWANNGKALSDLGNAKLDETQDSLNSAMSTIKSYQDSIYSLEQIMSESVTVGSDEFSAHAAVIAEDLYNIIQTGGQMADTVANTLGTSTSEIAQSLTENVSNQEIACQAIMANTNSAISEMSSSIGKLFNVLGTAISNFKVDISFGLKSVDWKSVNVFGRKLSFPEIQFELGASGESLDMIGSTLSAFGKSIASSYDSQKISIEDFYFGNTDAAKNRNYTPDSSITENYEKKLDEIRGSSKSSMQAAEKDWKEHLDQCLALYQAELDAGLIDFETFLSKSNALIEEYYRDGKISAKEYYDYVGKMLETQKGIYDKVLSAVTKRFDREIDRIQDSIDAIEKQNEALEKQKDEYDAILSVVDSVYEKQIEHIQSQQDAIQDTIDALQEENDVRKFALQLEQAKWELYQAQTQRTRKIFNGTEFVYDTDKDAIRDAQENLADLTFEQTVDGLEKEKDALDAVIEELEYYRSIWNEISSAREKSENEQLAIALWGKDYESLILSNRLSDIESFKDNYLSTQQQINDNQTLIDSYNEKIEYYEALKESWNSITDAYETSMNEQLAAQVLGADWESQILSGRLETLQHFRDEYIAIQQAIIDFAWQAANSVLAAQNAANTGGSTSGGGGATSNNSDVPKPTSPSGYATYKIVGDPNGYSSSGLATSQIVPLRGDGVVKRGSKWFVYKKIKTYSNAGKAQSQIVPDGGDGFIEAYSSGTANARKGTSLVGEKGAEAIIDRNKNVSLVTQPALIKMQGSETVKNAAATKDLLKNHSVISLGKNTPALKTQSDVLLEQWQEIVPDLSDLLLPARAALSTAHQFAETRSQAAPVVQNITLTLPNVTNNSGYERIKKELRQMQIDAYQNAHRRNP